jgi:Predicted dehydrogenases and related proteins
MNVEQTVLVIGYGSIGKRHSDVLNNLGYKVVVVSRRNFKRSNFYSNIEEALSKEDIQYIVIANETNMHLHTLQKLNYLGYRGKLLIEKPLALTSNINFHPDIFVGYNLRFHPIIQKVKKMLRNTKVLSVNCYVGQYLPTWRPNTDYTKCYSASKDLGGGVLNDLSHELDYLLLFIWRLEEVSFIWGKEK